MKPKLLGTIAYWYGKEIITQVLKFENDDDCSCRFRAEQGLHVINRLDKILYLQHATPKFYKLGE